MKIKNLSKQLKSSKRLLKLLALVLITSCALLLTSCRNLQTITKQTKSQTDTLIIKETLRDTLIKIKSDTTIIKALLECDSLGRVSLKQIEKLQLGTRTRSMISIENNMLSSECISDSIGIYLQLKTRFEKIKQSSETTKIIEVNSLTRWQEAQIWAGRVFIILIFLLIILLIIKNKIL